VYLGYRLGHVRGEDRVFRAIVYNKGAMALHMLRRSVGDDVFFDGMRRFYARWEFKKAGTDDFRQALEEAGGANLQPFFEYWIYGSSIPRIGFSYRVSGDQAHLRFEQRGSPAPMPLTVTVLYQAGGAQEFVVQVSDAVHEQTIPLRGAVRAVEANLDNAALVTVEK
jgi:aminopeptidase N